MLQPFSFLFLDTQATLFKSETYFECLEISERRAKLTHEQVGHASIFWIPRARPNRGYMDPIFASPLPLVSRTFCEKPQYNISTVASRPSHHGAPFLPDVWRTPGEHVVRVNKIPEVDRNVSDGVDLTCDTKRA